MDNPARYYFVYGCLKLYNTNKQIRLRRCDRSIWLWLFGNAIHVGQPVRGGASPRNARAAAEVFLSRKKKKSKTPASLGNVIVAILHKFILQFSGGL